VEVLRIIAILVSPVMPRSAEKIWKQLGLGDTFSTIQLEDAKIWGQYPLGTKVAKGKPVFPRYEIEEEIPAIPADTGYKPEPLKSEITIDQFSDMDFRVAKVLACEKVPKTDKLLKLTIDVGTDTRTIVSGISQYYKPEDLIGKHVVIVANLKPIKLRGIESKGMILAASDGEGNLIVPLADGMKPGSRVK
jgi:methionyl-tRNA synthetase